MKIKTYNSLIHVLFLPFFWMIIICRLSASENYLPFLCSDAYKDVRKNQLYLYLFQKNFSVLTQINHYLHNEIGHVNYIDFTKLEKHLRDASLAQCIYDRNTVHLCCLPHPYLSNLKNEICHFMEVKIIPSVWSFGKSCFLHEYEQINVKCPGYVFDGSIYYLDGHNYITLISNNGADSEEISTISLDNEIGRLEYIRFLNGDEEQLSNWPIDYSRKHCAMILYIIDDINQSFESLTQYIKREDNALLFIILSSNLQNNEQIMQKLRDKIGKKIAYKCEHYNRVICYCDSCKDETGVKLLYPDLFPDFSLPDETGKKDLKTKPIYHTREESTHLKTEKEESQLKENDVSATANKQSIEPENIDTSKYQKKILVQLFEFLRDNSKIISLSSFGIGSIIFILLMSYKYPRTL